MRGFKGSSLILPNIVKNKVIIMPSTREEPGIGSYQWKSCGDVVRLDNSSDRLPPCPRYHMTDYRKI